MTTAPRRRSFLELAADQPAPVVEPWPAGFALRPEPSPAPALCRRLYLDVGRDYAWTDRAGWTDDEWRAHAARAAIRYWVLWHGEELAGYFELKREEDDHGVELAYFGLLPAFVGRGLGSRLLSAAIREARALGTGRVWVHTATTDHPHALSNYHARGFRVFRVEDY
jgi:GNAT superfamily N-acetyltransferase